MSEVTVSALALRMRLEEQLDAAANAQAQRIVDDLIRGQACATDGDQDAPEMTLILSPVAGPTRRQRIRPHPDPGVAYLLEEASWTGCDWRHAGSEDLERVGVDGEVWHEADLVEVGDGP